MLIKLLKEIFTKPDEVYVYFRKDNLLSYERLENLDSSLDLNVIAVRETISDYYRNCYTESEYKYYYLPNLSEVELKYCDIKEQGYTEWMFGSYTKPIEVPANIQALGFTKGLYDYYECDSSD